MLRDFSGALASADHVDPLVEDRLVRLDHERDPVIDGLETTVGDNACDFDDLVRSDVET